MTRCFRADAGAWFNYPFLTLKERDNETGLDYFLARYYSSTQGRFTSIDPYNIVMERQNATDAKQAQSQFTTYLSNPQRWARYTYALNNPLLYTDPNGEDVTIYYRPAKEGAGSREDSGHIFIYVRNDETGESAYFDYMATGTYNDLGVTQIAEVNGDRIRDHASLTIETNASQEQTILDGIKAMQQSPPDYAVSPGKLATFSESTCVSNSRDLLLKGGLIVGGRTPQGLWNSAFENYGSGERKLATPVSMGSAGRPIYEGLANPQLGIEYGRDPRGQARVLDKNATNNTSMFYQGGKSVPRPKGY